MRILQVNSVYGRGSTGRIVQSIGANLAANGDDSYVAYGRGAATEENNLIRVGSGIDVARHGARSRVLDQHGLGSVRPTEELVNHIRDLQLDIIHLHNIHGYYLNYEVLFGYAKNAGTPVIWTLHDCWPFTGHCAYFTYAECDKWRTTCRVCPQSSLYPASIARDYSRENFRRKREAFTGHDNLTIVTPSRWLAALVRDSILQEYPTRVIQNDPDFGVFKPTQSDWKLRMGLVGRYLILGVAAHWEDRKGLRYLAGLAPNLRGDEVVIIVGKLPRGAKLPVGVVHIPATQDAGELAAIYTASDVLVNPTLEDNYPTTNLEAMACGTPVVTFDTGGSAETIARGKGRVVTQKSGPALREALDDLRLNPPISSDIGGEGALLPRPSVSMSEHYRGLYQEILA